MKRKRSDLALLLTVLVLFSASIGWLHGRKAIDPAMLADDVARITLTLEDALDYLQPLFIAGNMDAAAESLYTFSDPLIKEVISKLFSEKKSVLSSQDTLHLLLGALAYAPNLAKQDLFSSLIAEHFSAEPLFVHAVTKYPATMSLLNSWLMRNDKQSLRDHWREASVLWAVEQEDLDRLLSLYAYGIRPTKDNASRLLQQVVQENKPVTFVPFLVRQVGADSNYSPDGKRTLLAMAVDNKNEAMVRALLEVGADPNIILDSETGSAMQAAFSQGNVAMENLLRNY